MAAFKIAMIQMAVKSGALEENLDRAEALIGRAAEMGASLCLLPECCDIGWAHPNAATLASPVPGDVADRFSRIARANGVFVCAGVTEREGDALYNAALLISDEGALLGKHRKINVLVDVEGMYGVGDRLCVYDTRLGRIGVDICADNLPDSLVLGHALGRMGAELILSPCAWAVRPEDARDRSPYGNEWLETYGEIARLYGMPVVGVSNVGAIEHGAWQGWKCIGNSIAMGGDGTAALVMPYGEDAEQIGLFDCTTARPTYRGTALARHIDQLRD